MNDFFPCQCLRNFRSAHFPLPGYRQHIYYTQIIIYSTLIPTSQPVLHDASQVPRIWATMPSKSAASCSLSDSDVFTRGSLLVPWKGASLQSDSSFFCRQRPEALIGCGTVSVTSHKRVARALDSRPGGPEFEFRSQPGNPSFKSRGYAL